MSCGELEANYSKVLSEIKTAALKSGRKPEEITLIAVSKTKPSAMIRELYKLGHRDFGENYVQELVEKMRELSDLKDLRWHFIGHLQSNKAGVLCEHPPVYFHCVDSEKIMQALEKKASRDHQLKVFIQVNVDAEESKSGVSADEAKSLFQKCAQAQNIDVVGFMCIPDPAKSPEQAFQKMQLLADEATQTTGREARLSMGMSGDYALAIKHGAHFVRVGQAIFGVRS